MHSEKLKGKRALVTGAGTGIGKTIALEFAREGAQVALHYSHEDHDHRAIVAQITAEGGRAAAFAAKFEDPQQVQKLAENALKFLGGIDFLVNNAGITMVQPFEKVTLEQFDFLYSVNVRSPFFLTQACLPGLIESGGCVVNISSIHALRGSPGHSVYAGTKGAVAAYSRELAVELALKGVRVNTIAPGAIAVHANENKQELARTIPCGFAGEAVDVARLAIFLCLPEAKYIVGQTLVVDGGTTSWLAFGEGFRKPVVSGGKGFVPGM